MKKLFPGMGLVITVHSADLSMTLSLPGGRHLLRLFLETCDRMTVVSAHQLGDLGKCVETEVVIEGRKLRFLNTHFMTGNPKGTLTVRGLSIRKRLLLTAKTRQIQARALADLVKDCELPVIITGDFNSPPNSRAHEILKGELQDSFAASGPGFGFTYKENLPLWRIDYIWLRDLEASNCKELNPALSDHKAVKAIVRLK